MSYSNAAYCSMYDMDIEDVDPFFHETYVDEPYYDRAPPLGSSTPTKAQRPRRQRSLSAPRTATMNVLAPMIAQAREQGHRPHPTIRRSRSAVFTDSRRSCPRPSANLAVIPPNTRPLLPAPSPQIPSPKKTTWAEPPNRLPPSNNTLWLSGLFLLFTSTLNCLLCFYLLAKLGLQKGRYYYIDLAVISGFAMLVLGFVGVRTGRWDWVLNRNYLAGYMVLSMLDVLLCAVLGLLASDWRPPEMPEVLEIASGAVCGLSSLMLLLALCLGAASCCRTPPPDNRVAHSVPSFII